MKPSGEAARQPAGPPPRGPDRGKRFAWVLGNAQDKKRFRWPEWCALVCYAGLVAFAIPYHEPFVNEAQAWQLARTLSLGSLFHTFIHYEGSPILWHFLLWLVARAHVSYAGLHWICGAIGTAAAGVLIFKSPFPRYLRLSLPFTYFLIFQYAVVARNYVLAPLMLFALAACWKKRPILVTILLGLMANTALHVAVISGGLAVVYAIEQLRREGIKDAGRRRELLYCALLLVAFYGFAVWTAHPPHDLVMTRVRGESRPFFVSAIQSLMWGMCEPMLLSAPFWLVIAFWFAARRKIIYLLPVLLFAVFCGAVIFNWWHVGLLSPLLISIMWMNWSTPGSKPYEFETAGRVALTVMIVSQILWSGFAIYYDHYYAYAPDRAAAEFLKPYVQQGDGIAVTYVRKGNEYQSRAFPAIGVLPYFDRNIFVNTPYPFWYWSSQDPSDQRYDAAVEAHVPIVLVAVVNQHQVTQPDLDHPEFASLAEHGYRHLATFCGTMPQGFALRFNMCDVFYGYSGK